MVFSFYEIEFNFFFGFISKFKATSPYARGFLTSKRAHLSVHQEAVSSWANNIRPSVMTGDGTASPEPV
jgi:hypothetical protein